MPQNNNTDVTKQLRDGLKINQAYESVPNEIGKTIVPVFVSNPERVCNIASGKTKATTGVETIYTTPTDKDFFLHSLVLGVQSDVNCDSTYARLGITVNGVVTYPLMLSKLTLTVTSKDISLTFPCPIKLDRGTNITISTSYTVGAQIVFGSIIGYTVET